MRNKAKTMMNGLGSCRGIALLLLVQYNVKSTKSLTFIYNPYSLVWFIKISHPTLPFIFTIYNLWFIYHRHYVILVLYITILPLLLQVLRFRTPSMRICSNICRNFSNLFIFIGFWVFFFRFLKV